MALPIARLAAADLPACLDLAADRGWTPDPRKWALMLERCEVYGIRDPGGGLAGTVTLTRYGSRLAIVSMMLVALRQEVLARGPMVHGVCEFYKHGPSPMLGPRDHMMDDCVHAIDVEPLPGD